MGCVYLATDRYQCRTVAKITVKLGFSQNKTHFLTRIAAFGLSKGLCSMKDVHSENSMESRALVLKQLVNTATAVL
jgi:hypothetical protein